MIIPCPECGSRFKVADDKLRPGGVKVRCTQCRAVFKTAGDGPSKATSARFSSKPDRRNKADAPEKDPFDMDDPFGEAESMGPTRAGTPVFGGRKVSEPLPARDDPFDREDPFAVTAFGMGTAQMDGDGRTPSPPSPARPSEPEANEDPFGRDDPFAATAFNFDESDLPESLQSEDMPFEPKGRPGKPPPREPAPEPSRSVIEPMPGLERNAFESGGVVGGGFYADSERMEPEEKENSFLGDPDRARMMMDYDPGSAAEESEGPGAYFDPERNAVEVQKPRKTAKSSARKADNGLRGLEVRPNRGLETDPDPSWPDSMDGSVTRSEPVRAPKGGHLISASASVAEPSDGGLRIFQAIANLGLILLLAANGFLGFVAFKNDALLDFRALGDMIAGAFEQGGYTPRHLVEAADEAPEPAPEPKKLEVEGIEQVHYPNKQGEKLFVVEGQVVNHTEDKVEAIRVKGQVQGPDGDVIGTQNAPVGRTMSEEELLDVVDADALSKVYGAIEKDAEALVLGPGQAMKFTLVFLDLPGKATDKRTLKVEVGAHKPTTEAKPAP